MNSRVYKQVDEALELIRDGKVEKGLSLLQSLMDMSQMNPDISLQLADVFYELGHVETALSLFSQMEKFWEEIPTEMQVEAKTLKAEILIDSGELDQAMDELLYCLDIEPDFTRASILMADIYLMQNFPEVACKYLEDVLKREPDQEDVRFIIGEIYLELGDWQSAQDHWNKLEGTPYESKIMLGKAKLLGLQGQFEEAYSLYRECLEQEASPEILFGLMLTTLQLNLPEETIHYGEQLLSLDPDYFTAYIVLSDVYRQIGQHDKAIMQLQKALSLNDQDETVLLKLIELTASVGETDKALEYVEQLLEINDEHETALEWKAKLTIQLH
jgi:tetratricopeptide (TPR) repeat protein